jgi:hypothetical protein
LIVKQNYKHILRIFAFACRFADEVVFAVPGIADRGRAAHFAVSFQKMKPYLLALCSAARQKNIPLTITDIPFCVFGFYRKNIINLTAPPLTSEGYAIPEEFASALPGIPRYRVKSKFDMCLRCSVSNRCGGFLNDYVQMFGLKDINPL